VPTAERWELSRKWEAITPDELRAALEAIRHTFEHYGCWRPKQCTMKLCFAALHPASPNDSGRAEAEDLGPYRRFLVALLGPRVESLLLGSNHPAPVIFKSYLDVLEAALGFLEDGQYRKLVEYCPELWFRSLVECGRTYGRRVSELLSMRVNQVDVAQRVIRLEPGTTKNLDGREVLMTASVHKLLSALVHGKSPDDYVFTRANGKPVRDFRGMWQNACAHAGVPELLFHDLRRTGARNLRRAGVAEGIIMKIGGWRTRSVFERYAIVSRSDMNDAILKLQESENRVEQDRLRAVVLGGAVSDRLNEMSDRQIGQLLFDFCWPELYVDGPELIIVTQAIDRLRRSTGGAVTNEEAQDNLKQQPVCPKCGNEMFLHYGIDKPDFWLCDCVACRSKRYVGEWYDLR
jgi:integrase